MCTVLFQPPPEWVCTDKTQVPPKMFPNRETQRLVLHDEDGTSKVESDCRRINTLGHYQVSMMHFCYVYIQSFCDQTYTQTDLHMLCKDLI